MERDLLRVARATSRPALQPGGGPQARRPEHAPPEGHPDRDGDARAPQRPRTDALGLRDRAILETLYSTGLRRAELCGLNPYDLDFPGEVVLVRQGKGGRDRVVPIGKVALAAVRHVQLILSHASVATTQIYTRVAVDDLVAAHRRHHPRNYLHIPLQLK